MTTADHPARIEGFRSRMTEAEFEQWAMRERVCAEWVEGKVILMSPVSYDHTNLVKWLLTVMNLFAEKHQLGEVQGSEYMNRLRGRRRTPDLFFVAKGRELLFTRTYFDGAADLIVEIVSPDSQSRDRREKYLEYQAAGVREYWIIDPLSQQAEFYRLADGQYVPMELAAGVIRSLVFTGFWLEVDWLWQRPLPDSIETARALGII